MNRVAFFGILAIISFAIGNMIVGGGLTFVSLYIFAIEVITYSGIPEIHYLQKFRRSKTYWHYLDVLVNLMAIAFSAVATYHFIKLIVA